MRKVGSSNLILVKVMTYKIDICRYLPWRPVLIGHNMDWSANVNPWDIGPWTQWSGLLLMATLQVRTRPGMTLTVARMQNNNNNTNLS